MRTANAALVTFTALLSAAFLGQMAAVWDRPLPPYPDKIPTPGQTASIEHHIAINRALFLAAALAWLVTIGVVAARRLGKPTVRSAFSALATLAALLTGASVLYGLAIEVGSSQPYPHPALTPEQAAYRRSHLGIIDVVAWAILLAWLLAGVALVAWLLALAARRVRGPAGPGDATRSDREAGPGAYSVPARPGRLVRGFATLHWWLSLAWIFLGERALLSGLSRLRNLGDEAFMRQFGNPHLYARSEAILATADLIAGAILLVMTATGLLLAYGLRRGRAWSRWLALGQSALLVLAGGVISLALMFDEAKGWKASDACQWMLPGLFLGLFTLLLWSWRFGPDCSSSAVPAEVRPPR